MIILCGCGHDLAIHDNPDVGTQLMEVSRVWGEAMATGADVDEALDRVEDSAWQLPRPCLNIDCACPQFSPLPLPDGTYIPTNIGEDGFEIVRHDYTGPERRCCDCRRPIGLVQQRYTVRLFQHLKHDEVEERAVLEDLYGWPDENDADLEDPRTHWDVEPRGVPTTMCLTCVISFAANGPLPDLPDE